MFCVSCRGHMGAVRTAHGSVYRPRLGRARILHGAVPLHQTSCREDEAVAVVIASPAPPGSPAATDQPDRLTGLCRELGTAPDASRSMANYRYTFFGSTGADDTLVGFVNRATAIPLGDARSASRSQE